MAKRLSYSQSSLEQSIVYLPLVGSVVGAVAGVVFWGAHALLGSVPLAVLLSMVASVALTGAIHEDGLADFFDAFGGGWWSKERILEIMKDSRVGTFGAVALVMALLLKFQSLSIVGTGMVPVVLIAGHAFSRLVAGSFIYTDTYVRENDQSFFKPMVKERMKPGAFVIMAVIGVTPLLLLGSWWYLLLVPLLWGVRQLFGRWFIRKIGGYTGDCLGATQQIIELCFYLGVIAIARLL